MGKLKEKSALGGFKQDWNGLSIAELTEFELISVAAAQGAEAEFKSRFKKALETDLPIPNQVLPAKGGSVMWTGQGQYLVMLGASGISVDVTLGKALAETAYTVLQSDGWACLRLEGERFYDVMDRFIPLDLRSVADDFAARTQAHHTSVIVVKLLDGSWLLLTPRSSAQSFLDALTHTVDNTLS